MLARAFSRALLHGLAERRQMETKKYELQVSCAYCGGNCPNEPDDSEFLCDGFSGDIEDLYKDG